MGSMGEIFHRRKFFKKSELINMYIFLKNCYFMLVCSNKYFLGTKLSS